MREKVFVCLFLCALLALNSCNKGKNDIDPAQTYVDSIAETEVQPFPTNDSLSVAELAQSEKVMVDSVKHDPRVSDEPYDMPMETPPAPPATAKPAKTKVKMVYANAVEGYVNVRKEPTVKSEALGRLVLGGKGAKFIANEGEWYKVEYKGTTAYVKRVYATFDSIAKPKADKPKTEKPKADTKPAAKPADKETPKP